VSGPLALCYGTRPQTIKASVLVDVLGARWPLLTVDTGQHYDYALNALLYEQLGVRSPDVCLDVGSADHATQTAAILTRSAQLFAERRPWTVVVIGDTNSTLGCALAAAKLRIPVVHVEAGLRARDLMMAEEINRRVVDQISSVLCAPSAAAEAQLRGEQVPGVVVRTGDVARDVLARHAGDRPRASALPGWPLPPMSRSPSSRSTARSSSTRCARSPTCSARSGGAAFRSFSARTRAPAPRSTAAVTSPRSRAAFTSARRSDTSRRWPSSATRTSWSPTRAACSERRTGSAPRA
jgi:hypothetical protein